jgi:hypothetical protein
LLKKEMKMKKLALLLLMPMIVLLSPAAHAAWETGELLDKDCTSKRPTGNFYCYGYVVGVVDVLTGLGVLCAPPEVSKKQLRDQVAVFLQQTPAALTMDADVAVYEALKAYQCKVGP